MFIQRYDVLEFPFRKPEINEAYSRSALHVVFTDKGNAYIAVYDKRTNMWYSLTNNTGFDNVTHFTRFDFPFKFEESKELIDLQYGKGAYEIKS